MSRGKVLLFLFFLLMTILPFRITGQTVVISGYSNATDPRDEWTEILVLNGATDVRAWQIQDNNSTQTSFQPPATFSNNGCWNSVYPGTIIMIHHRSISFAGTVYPVDVDKTDGYMEVSANDASYFTGGDFGTAPAFGGATLNIAGGGDLLRLVNSGGTFVHALGHKSAPGSSWGTLPSPKLNHLGSLADGEAVYVCPGAVLNDYGTNTPQSGTSYTASGSVASATFGLPNNCTASATANTDFWRSIRQPSWPSPGFTGNAINGNTQVLLSWNAADDPLSGTSYQGYMILRSTGSAGIPADGTTYNAGDMIGSATVVAVISSSLTTTYTDNFTVPCTGVNYRIFAWRFNTDLAGNSFHPARGRAYNELPGQYGETVVTGTSTPLAVSITADQNPACTGATVTFTSTTPSGTGPFTYQWNVNGNPAGPNAPVFSYVPANGDLVNLVVSSADPCYTPGTSNTITMIVGAALVPSVTIVAAPNPVCDGMTMTFTATPVNGGTIPAYQWMVNGTPAGTGAAVYSYVPVNGDNVYVVMTSNDPCASAAPVPSNTIMAEVSSQIPVSATISVDPGNIFCSNDDVTFTVTPVNGGDNPQYEWFLNGTGPVSNTVSYNMIPADNDEVWCRVTSDMACAGPPATSDTIIMEFATAVTVTVSITADPGSTFCDASPVTFTAIPVNGGTSPIYQWYLNGMATGPDDSEYTIIPNPGDRIHCIVTSSLLCADTPGRSDTITMVYTPSIPVSVSISAQPGTTVCSGTPVTFVSNPVNGGSNPIYLWKVNGVPSGSSTPTYSYIPSDGDSVVCIMLSDLQCVTGNPATSEPALMSVSDPAVFSAGLTADPSGPVCEGTAVNFEVSAVNGGNTPGYEWFVNGNPTGSSISRLTTIPADSDRIWCRITSSQACVSPNPFVTDTITISASATLTPSLAISPGKSSMCPGDEMVFTASYTEAGSAPFLEWMVDGTVVQSDTSRLFTSTTLTSEQAVTCRLTCNLPCATVSEVLSVPLLIPQSDECFPVFLPTAFSPDGNNLNDRFRVITENENITDFRMYIYNRWGQEIYRTEDITYGWNGQVNGQWAEGGTYSWKITWTELQSGETRIMKGTVILIK